MLYTGFHELGASLLFRQRPPSAPWLRPVASELFSPDAVVALLRLSTDALGSSWYTFSTFVPSDGPVLGSASYPHAGVEIVLVDRCQVLTTWHNSL